jgi:UDP-4-amino-4,6-dideoxy-N-acetyl-beta-L-altrosamine transaminase
MEKLAIEGGTPVRDHLLAYGRQYIDDDDIAAVCDVMRSDFLTTGPTIARAERRLKEITGARYCVAVSSGTTALHCACMAAGIGPGDEVITTPITFAASANCVLYCGGTPIFADIDRKTWEISPESIAQCISPRTKAVIAVDYAGQPCDYDSILKICRDNNLTLIEDAAHAMGTRYKGRHVGTIADMTTFSFHPVKTVTSGEGGAIMCASAETDDHLRLAAKHGITHKRELTGTDDGWYYDQILLGTNYRITDIQSALLISQLDKLELFARRRRELTQKYLDAFADMPEIILQEEYEGSETVRHLFVIRLNPDRLRVGRRRVFDALRAENIGVNTHYIPVYWFPYYRHMGYRRGICPDAESLYENIITLPLYYSMTGADADDVIGAVKKVVAYYGVG